MGHRKFSTDDADYYLVFDNHLVTTTDSLFRRDNLKNIDAIVLECSGIGYKNPIAIEHGELVSKIKNYEKDIPFFFVDIDLNAGGYATSIATMGIHLGIGYTLCKSASKSMKSYKEKKSRRDFLKSMLKGIGGLAIFTGYLGKAASNIEGMEHVPVVSEIEDTLDRLPPSQVFALRNAVAAKKLEDFVVPMLKYRLKRKPTIALVYGSAHAGLENDLKGILKRENTMAFYKKIDFLGVDKENLKKIIEIDVKSQKRKEYTVEFILRHDTDQWDDYMEKCAKGRIFQAPWLKL